MTSAPDLRGDDFLELLGLALDAPGVQAALARWARGMQPELDPDEEDCLFDHIAVPELGLELGFEDEAYVRALDPDLRRRGPLLLTQLYFYGNTPGTRAFPGTLPFNLSFADDRRAVRQRLTAYEATRRSYVRDAWTLSGFDVAATYGETDGLLESIFCHVRPTPWPPAVDARAHLAQFTPGAFHRLFGLRWSNSNLRERLAPLGYEDTLKQVRVEHTADFRIEYGVELVFMPSAEVRAADRRYPAAYAFAGVNYYASRELDAREWVGPLPCDLSFSDTLDQMAEKAGRSPDVRTDESLSGTAHWRFDAYTLSVVYSTVENRLLRVAMMAPTTGE